MPGTPATAIRLQTDEVDYWCARLDDHDKNVAGRVWSTEISIAHHCASTRALFGLRQIMATSEENPVFVAALPGVIRQIAKKPGLSRNGRPITEHPTVISSEANVQKLIELIEDPERIRPVYLLSLGEGETDITTAKPDPGRFAVRCIGIAHVVVITGPATYHLTDRIGKPLSVFHGAVRTYRPHFDYGDNPFDHPLALPNAIANWSDTGPEAFANFLVERAAAGSFRHTRGDVEFPGYSAVKKAELQLARQVTEQTEEQALSIATDEIDALKDENES